MLQQIQLKASNGQYVCAEGGGGREVVANRAVPSDWETFLLIDPNAAQLRSGDRVVLQVYNRMYVCAEGGGGQQLVANRNLPASWETFVIFHADQSGGEITNGQAVSFRANNNQYVCAEGGGGREVVANRNAIGPWETFTIAILGTPPLRGHQGADHLTRGEWMETNTSFSNNGRLDTKTHIWTTNELYGFTGGVGIFFLDAAENVIGNAPMRSYGVDGTWIPGKPSARSILQTDDLGVDLFNKAVKIEILHRLAPRNRLIEDIDAFYYVGKKIYELYSDFFKNGRA